MMSTRLTVWSVASPGGDSHSPFIICHCGHRDDYPHDVLDRRFGPWTCPACRMRYTRATCSAAYDGAQRAAFKRLVSGRGRMNLPLTKTMGPAVAWTDDPGATPIENFRAVQQMMANQPAEEQPC